MLKDPDVSIQRLTELIRAEPLLSTKLIGYANSAALRGAGKSIEDLQGAIMRVGLDAVRTVSYSVAMEQMIRSKHMQPFQDISNHIWLHSLAVAAVGREVARKVRMNPEKAFYLGIVHDIGAFYLLFRCTTDSVLTSDRLQLQELIYEWHDGIGHALLSAMGQPDDILDPVQNHESPGAIGRLNNWTAILATSDTLGQLIDDWVPAEIRAQNPRCVDESVLAAADQEDIMDKAREEMNTLRAALF
jgi:HD-like signal output (HDOD) protein